MSTPLGEPLGVQAGEDLERNDEAAGGPSLVAQAFEGWLLMAEAVAETDESLARVMTTGAYLARAAFEERVPALLNELADTLTATDLAFSVRDEVIGELATRLYEPRFPFSRNWMLEQHRNVAENYQDPEQAGRRLLQMVSTALQYAIEPESAKSKETFEPPEKKHPGEWRIISTLERPSKIGHPASLFCCTPGPGFRPYVRLEETSYQGITRISNPDQPIQLGQWVVLAQEGGGRDFNEREPPAFPMGLHNPPELANALGKGEIVSSAAYFLQVDTRRHREEIVSQFIEKHKEAICTTVKTAITGAADLIPGGLLVPLGVLNMIPDLIIGAIQAILKRRIAATILPNWLIQHTVIKVGDQPPRSAVLLRSEDQPDITLAGAQVIDGKIKAVDDYNDFPVPQLWPRGRILIGATEPKAVDADLSMIVPADLWDWVDDHRRPLVWSDAWESGKPPTHGFQVLVPFSPSPSARTRKQPNGPHYVAALRVEVYFRRGFSF